MRKYYGLALLLAALLVCAGCAMQEQEDPAQESSASEETAQDPAEEATEEQTPGTDEEERVAVYEGEEITITVPARYA